MSPDPITVLLRGVVDYAGMFPPAAMTPERAASAYARYRAGPYAWMLGTLVVSAQTLEQLLPSVPDEERWPLGLVFSGRPWELEAALAAIETSRKASSFVVEFAPVPAGDIAGWIRRLPSTAAAFFEVPLDADMEARLDAIGAARALAKMRTGGVTRDTFPRAADIVRFLRGCVERGIACKATAGLHHAIHGTYVLTYDSDSDTTDMHGFLNMLLLAAAVRDGASERDALELLTDRRPTAFHFDARTAAWCGRTWSIDDLANTRRALFRSFGSCSFEEPVAELRAMGLL